MINYQNTKGEIMVGDTFNKYSLTRLQKLELNRIKSRNKFWEDVKIISEDKCWIYQGMIDRGVLHRMIREIVWKLERGEELPDECSIRHSCKNSRCCNPNHLYLK